MSSHPWPRLNMAARLVPILLKTSAAEFSQTAQSRTHDSEQSEHISTSALRPLLLERIIVGISATRGSLVSTSARFVAFVRKRSPSQRRTINENAFARD